MSSAEQIVQSTGASIGTTEESRRLFALSRRHALPFGVIALRMRPQGVLAAEDRPGTSRARMMGRIAELEALAASQLRSTDLMLRSKRGEYCIIICPLTPSQGVKEICRRIVELGQAFDVQAGEASLHVDGLTFDDLLSTACERAGLGAGSDLDGLRRELLPVSRSSAARSVETFSRRIRRWTKRAFDVTVVLLSAPLWLPIMTLTALLVKLSDPSAPVIYRQVRTGLGGRRFHMLKFRTMVQNADQLKEELRHLSQRRWPDFKIEKDPRITPIGAFLRRTSLDEVPQMINILKGDMSLVGPRPTSFSSDVYEPWQTARLDVLPGLTGLWQVEGRGITDFDERLRLDLEYVDRQSFLLDLWLLVKTVVVVVKMKGGH